MQFKSNFIVYMRRLDTSMFLQHYIVGTLSILNVVVVLVIYLQRVLSCTLGYVDVF